MIFPLLVAPAVLASPLPCLEEHAEALPAPPANLETIGGRPTLRYLPPQPKGLVYVFHGSGGSETFATRVHTQRVLSHLIAAGYGYISAPSLERQPPRRWNNGPIDPAANPDASYLLSLRQTLIERGEMTAKTPIFTMGMSAGGAFSNVFAAAAKAQGLPVIAVADYMGPFPAPMRAAVGDPHKYPPTLVILSRNDGLVNADQTAAVAAELDKGGASIEVHVNSEHRVCPQTFALIPGMTPADRETLVKKTLVEAGLIDAEGERTIFKDHPTITHDDIAALQSKLAQIPQGRLISDELLIAWAGHQMRSDFATRQVAFFDKALADAGRR
jgi:dienelactone hydrolase